LRVFANSVNVSSRSFDHCQVQPTPCTPESVQVWWATCVSTWARRSLIYSFRSVFIATCTPPGTGEKRRKSWTDRASFGWGRWRRTTAE